MIGYPFDSIVSFDQHGNPVYDRAVSSQPLKALIQKLFTTGIMPNPSDNLQVFEGSEGMTVIVHPGFCVIEGGLKLEEAQRVLELQAADTTYDRIDTVVMRWDDNVSARNCDLYVVTGTPAASPVRPELTRVGSIYEIGLADVFVPSNSSVIAQERITDTRYETGRCGIVSSVSEWDTTTIYEQVQSDLADFKSEEQAEFLAWFETIQDILDENVAAHLQAEIDALDVQADWNQTNTEAKDYIKNKPTIADTKVKQTTTTTNADYRVLMSSTADDTTRTEGARKSDNFKYNPSTGNLQITQLNGVTVGNDPKFTDTTYTQGTGISISNNQINITKHAASYVNAGTLAGRVRANATAAATLGNAQVRDIYAGTADMTEGSTALATGAVYLQYEA